MLRLRPHSKRGTNQIHWLKSFHSFSFGDFYDPNAMGFGALRVINEDWIAGTQGFGTHPHQNMEIITYVLEGTLAHKDSMGNGSYIEAGNVQRMTAGTGITHSEFNPGEDPVHLFQVWIIPNTKNLTPSYEEKRMEPLPGQLQLLASPKGEGDSVLIHQDALFYRLQFQAAQEVAYSLNADRMSWVQVVQGSITINGETLQTGDAAEVVDENLILKATSSEPLPEILLFDLKKEPYYEPHNP